MVKSFKKALSNFREWFDKTFPQKFEFRYDKLAKDFLTVPLEELEAWDADYKKRLKDTKVSA